LQNTEIFSFFKYKCSCVISSEIKVMQKHSLNLIHYKSKETITMLRQLKTINYLFYYLVRYNTLKFINISIFARTNLNTYRYYVSFNLKIKSLLIHKQILPTYLLRN
jgi:hypothetical protein